MQNLQKRIDHLNGTINELRATKEDLENRAVKAGQKAEQNERDKLTLKNVIRDMTKMNDLAGKENITLSSKVRDASNRNAKL